MLNYVFNREFQAIKVCTRKIFAPTVFFCINSFYKPALYKFENVVVGAGAAGSQLGKQRLCASSLAATEPLR